MRVPPIAPSTMGGTPILGWPGALAPVLGWPGALGPERLGLALAPEPPQPDPLRLK